MLRFTHWIFCIFLFISHSLCALTTLIVTSSTDDDPGGMGNVGELRYYLNLMNENLSTGSDDYAITFQFPMTITLNGNLPIINNSTYPVSITIGNSGSIPTVTIDGNGAYSGFFIPNGNVTIQNMNFQNLIAKGGDGGDGISGGGGGMGAGGAIYAPTNFLNGTSPMVTLMNVSIRSCTAQGGTGGKYLSLPFPTGDEGGGGGGGFAGNGGSITVTGDTGGGGGGGFGGKGGDVTLSLIDLSGGGGGGGGLGSLGPVGSTNLGNGGSDQSVGADGNGDGLSYVGGTGGGGYLGGNNAGGGGGGAPTGGATSPGGGGGGSHGSNGLQPQSTISGDLGLPSGGGGGGGGGGGSGLGAAVFVDTDLNFTIQAISGVPTTFNTTDNTVQSGTGGGVVADSTLSADVPRFMRGIQRDVDKVKEG